MMTDQTIARQDAAFEEWYHHRPMAYCAITKDMLRRLFDFAWDAALKELDDAN
jgi:hypothetical protein